LGGDVVSMMISPVPGFMVILSQARPVANRATASSDAKTKFVRVFTRDRISDASTSANDTIVDLRASGRQAAKAAVVDRC